MQFKQNLFVNRSVTGGLAVALLGAVAVSARPQNTAPPPAGQTDKGKTTPVEIVLPVAVTVKTDKATYAPNTPVVITMTVKNTTKETVKLTFPDGMTYDIEIRRGKERNGEKIWQWSQGRMFTQMVRTVPYEAGKTRTFTETFHPAGDKATLTKPVTMTAGSYTVIATLATSGRAPRPHGVTTFTVR